MQFINVVSILALFAGASMAETVTVYACPSTSVGTSTATATSGAASGTGYASGTGVISSPSSTGSPISYATGAASNVKAGSALGLFALGGVALLI